MTEWEKVAERQMDWAAIGREMERRDAEIVRLREELNAAGMAMSRWLAHQWGPQKQYVKMQEARDAIKWALNEQEVGDAK